MKWIGQHIYDLISRFRSDVYLEDVSSGTIASGGNLGLDSNNKIVKAAEVGSAVDLTSEVTGSLPVANGGTGATSLTADGVLFGNGTSAVSAVDLSTDGDIVVGGATPKTVRASVLAGTGLTSTAGDGTLVLDVEAAQSGLTSFGSAGATSNIVAGDLTMYNTVNDGNPTISLGSSATNRLEIKTSYNSSAQTLDEVSLTTYTSSTSGNDGKFKFYVDEALIVTINDGGIVTAGAIQSNIDGASLSAYDTTTSSATEGGKLRLIANDGAVMGDNHRLGVIEFYGAEDGSNTISVGARIQAIARDAWDGSNNDTDLEFYTTDGTTESKVLTLDADKLATFTGAVTATGALSGTLATVSQPNITGVGTITTGVWNGTAVNSEYLDADTAHLSGIQSFTGAKTFGTNTGSKLIVDGDSTVTPGDGAAIHIDGFDVVDGGTSASGTAARYAHVNIENPRLLSLASSITTTDAATLYIKGPPVAHTNMTITNPWALWVDAGNARFDGDIDLEGDMDINGTLETDALTIGGTTVAAAGTTSITTLGTIGTGVWNGTAIATAYIADDAVTFAKASGVSPNVFGNIIKLLPSDFAANIDGGNTKLGVGYTDTAGSAYGMKVGSANTELFAFVSIPEGMKATHVDVFDKDSRALEVFEVQINATSFTSKGSGNCNTTLDITDVNATATNFLAIKITTTATTDKVFGGQVTIAAQ